MATPKTKFTKKMKCINVQQGIGRASVSFASEIKTVEDNAATTPGQQRRQQATAKNLIQFNSIDPADAAGFTPDKEYTITITE